MDGVAYAPAVTTPPVPTVDDLVRETIEFLQMTPDGDRWVATAPAWFGDYLFGGFVVAQALAAAAKWVPAGSRVHSMHAYFLRPVKAGEQVVYSGTPLREGRSFTAFRLDAEQAGKPVLTMLASFTADTDGYEYDLAIGDPLPPLDADAAEPGPGPWTAAWVGPTDPRPDGSRTSTHRMWFRIPVPLPDDPHLHAALLGFATDWTGTGGRPLHLDGDTQGMVSLDHAAWFHRPCRADEWLFYDVQSLVNAGGRGLLRGVMRNAKGEVVVSVAQEMRLTPIAAP